MQIMPDVLNLPEQLREGYELFGKDSDITLPELQQVEELGEYYAGLVELAGDRYNVFHGNFSEEDSNDPALWLVVEREGIDQTDHRYWRVVVDPEGNTVVNKHKKGRLSDTGILEVAGEVLREGDLVADSPEEEHESAQI